MFYPTSEQMRFAKCRTVREKVCGRQQKMRENGITHYRKENRRPGRGKDEDVPVTRRLPKKMWTQGNGVKDGTIHTNKRIPQSSLKVGAIVSLIKRDGVLIAVFVLCCLLMVKASSIPYPFDPPYFVSLLFDCPKDDFWGETMKLISVIASAYVASMVFYYFVTVLPGIKRERKVEAVLGTQINGLYILLVQWLAIIECLEKTGGITDGQGKRWINVENVTKVYKTTWAYGDEPMHSILEKRNFYYDLDKNRRKIVETCFSISNTLGYIFVNPDLIQLVSELQQNRLINNMVASLGTEHIRPCGSSYPFDTQELNVLRGLKVKLEERLKWVYFQSFEIPASEEAERFMVVQEADLEAFKEEYPNSEALLREMGWLMESC